MSLYAASEGERRFEELWAARTRIDDLVVVANKAARSGRVGEVELCLVRIAEHDQARAAQIRPILESILRSVREHPARGRLAS